MTEEKNKKTVLYVVEDIASAQFRYRVKNVLKALDGSSKWKAEWILTENVSEEKIARADLIVILRQTAKNRKLLDFIKLAKRRGIKVLFDLDDLVFDYRYLLVLMRATNSRNIFYWMGYFLGIRRIAKRVDGFITTNNFLGKKLKQSFGKLTVIIPNSLNMEQVKLSEELKGKKDGKEFLVGYFSGSPTHAKDFRMMEDGLIRFLEKHNNARLDVVGYMEFSARMEEQIRRGRVRVFKPVNYLRLEKMMAKVDVNIAPLVISDFTNSKSELKFFEAAVVETTTIASPTYVFSRAISEGENGLLATPNEWFLKLEYLYEHPDDNRRMAKAAREFVLKNYYGKKFLKQVEGAYERFA